SHILWKVASRSSIFVTCIVSFSPVLASINSLVPRNFTFFLVVLGLLYLFSIYFYSSYSVMKLSYQMFCPKLCINTIIIFFFLSNDNRYTKNLVHTYKKIRTNT